MFDGKFIGGTVHYRKRGKTWWGVIEHMGMGYAYVRPEGNPRRKLHYVRSREVIIEKEEKSQ